MKNINLQIQKALQIPDWINIKKSESHMEFLNMELRKPEVHLNNS